MSRSNQHATAFVISQGGDVEALDTYGYTPLHRMASNNLAVGARALLEAGADPAGLATSKAVASTKQTPLEVATQSDAKAVLAVLREFGAERGANAAGVASVTITAANYPAVVGQYTPRSADEIPTGFGTVCEKNGWPSEQTWSKLNGGEHGRWFAHESNDSYIYYNAGDGMWWIDGPDGLGAYKAKGVNWAPPGSETAWQVL